MAPDRLLPSLRHDLVFAVVALGLLTAPLWVAHLPVGERTYHYERVEVVPNGTDIEYGTDTDRFPGPISDEIACAPAGSLEVRPCALEQLVLDNETIPTEVYSSHPGPTRLPVTTEERYQYVRIDGSIYEPTYVANDSEQRGDGMYRVDLTLNRTAPDRALESVSRRVTSDDLSPTVVEAARSGDARAHREADVPETPIRLEDGTYYRVYLTEYGDSSAVSSGIYFVLRYIAPLAGLIIALDIWQRIEVTHTGATDAATEFDTE
ncbi:hypothetical protein [Natrinema salsiterrestre]|uniref:Uncharacterized protein n=1 Tax=Natrinema salsiterrestre TaxID=2950540 RepID=A0A9Q4Q2U7_9EURY|nr:hypothetical protein [Natrinema salsiterrestre]MDF9745608.1 hypothetical protein [Natrinema salsiterrestre]